MSTLSICNKNKEKIQIADWQPERKHARLVKNGELETALFVWFKKARGMSFAVTGPVLCLKAKEMVTMLKANDFTANSEWADHFRKLYGIVCKTVCGEKAAAHKVCST